MKISKSSARVVLFIALSSLTVLAFQNFSTMSPPSAPNSAFCPGAATEYECGLTDYRRLFDQAERMIPELDVSVVGRKSSAPVSTMITGQVGLDLYQSFVMNQQIYSLYYRSNNFNGANSYQAFQTTYAPVFKGPIPAHFEFMDSVTGDIVYRSSARKVVSLTTYGAYPLATTRDNKLYWKNNNFQLLATGVNPYTLSYFQGNYGGQASTGIIGYVADLSNNIALIRDSGELSQIATAGLVMEFPTVVKPDSYAPLASNVVRICSLNSNHDYYCQGYFGSVGSSTPYSTPVTKTTTIINEPVLLAQNICATGLNRDYKNSSNLGGTDYIVITCDGAALTIGGWVMQSDRGNYVVTQTYLTKAIPYTRGSSFTFTGPDGSTPSIPTEATANSPVANQPTAPQSNDAEIAAALAAIHQLLLDE